MGDRKCGMEGLSPTPAPGRGVPCETLLLKRKGLWQEEDPSAGKPGQGLGLGAGGLRARGWHWPHCSGPTPSLCPQA